MKRALMVLTVLLCACASVRRAPLVEMDVIVYNIHAGKDAAGVENLRQVAQAVRGEGGDIVLLQEVDRGTARSGRVDQVARLSEFSGMHAAFGNTLDYQGGQYGIAVLSRWPILRDTLIRLAVSPPQQRAGGAYEPRGALLVEIQTPAGILHVINTHMDASREDFYRMQEAATVLRVADSVAAQGRLVLVGGDFNAEPASRVHQLLTSRSWRDPWLECGDTDSLTYPAVRPVKRIDYLLIPAGVRCRRAAVAGYTHSDHRLVRVTIQIPER